VQVCIYRSLHMAWSNQIVVGRLCRSYLDMQSRWYHHIQGFQHG
jgi:hypothetical protein